MKKYLQKAFLKKSYEVAMSDENNKLERTMSLFDLLCIGIGGTVGSGIFVLTGVIASDYAGPGVVYSWILAGIGCTFSGLSYAELSCLIPSSGSSYAYTYVGLGEYLAFLAAWCLTLEYGISGAAVAASWGDKVQTWISSFGTFTINIPINDEFSINFLGGFLQLLVVLLMLRGADVSKNTVNFFTVLKMILIAFMIIGGFTLYNSANIGSTWIPYGVKGVFRGAASSFFGYIGYDEVCCLAGEAKSPKTNMPLAVVGTIATVTIFYTLASIVLVGMQYYQDINPDAGFSMAFGANGWIWAQNLVAAGEIITLPVVVLVSFIAQPRLQYALAVDGLLPPLFSQIDAKGNLYKGILIGGIICICITVFVPFVYLDDMISAGVLFSFNLTNSALIAIRYNGIGLASTLQSNIAVQSSIHSNDNYSELPTDDHKGTNTGLNVSSGPHIPNHTISNELKYMEYVYKYLIIYHVIAIITACLMNSNNFDVTQVVSYVFTILGLIVLIALSILLYQLLPISRRSNDILACFRKKDVISNDTKLSTHEANIQDKHFQVPFLPFIPCLGILVNYYLISQLSIKGIGIFILYFVIATCIYFGYSLKHSIGNTKGWNSYEEMNQ